MSRYGEPFRPSKFADNPYGKRYRDIVSDRGFVFYETIADVNETAEQVIERRDHAILALNAVAGLSDAALAAGVVARMAALLRDSEWDGECWPVCPYDGGHCRECNGHMATGHKADCERGQLLALLGDAPAGG